MLDISDTAPDFTLPRDDGQAVTLSTLRPGAVVLFFYPRDDTSGCTAEALAFSALKDAFDAAGGTILGLSKDSVESHAKFRAKHALNIPLLSDEHADICEKYGVWREKSMYGKTFFGIERSSFLIDGAGRVAKVWRKVKVPGHAEEVLAALKSL